MKPELNQDSHSNAHSHAFHLPELWVFVFYFIGLGLYLLGFFIKDPTISMIINLLATVFAGYDVISEGLIDTIHETKHRKKFHPNVHLLMTIGALGAIAIGEYREAALLILIFAGAHLLEEYAEAKSSKEISNLLKMNPTTARRILDDGSIEEVDVQTLKINDKVSVLNGDQVPTDGIVLSGNSSVDQSAITGESIPVEVFEGSMVYGGTINGSGTFIFEVSKDSSETVFAKIIEMVSQAQINISKTATLIKRISPIYVTGVLILAPLFYWFGLSILKWDRSTSFYKTMVLLIGASPCALAVADIPATLASISNLARQGVLFKGGSHLSNLADVKAVAFDKTGTLTQGKPEVTELHFTQELTPSEKEELLTLLVSMEAKSNHPLAQAILRYLPQHHIVDIDVENRIGEGLVANYQDHQYQIGKPESFGSVSSHLQELRATLEHEGKTVVYLSKDQQVYMLLGIQDVEKQTSKEAIDYLKAQGIQTVMITGDSKLTGEAIGRNLGISEVRANVMPDQKSQIIQELKNQYGVVAMLGDGVNDAPALVAADIGVAMGDGTDIAIDVADAVLMKNDLSRFIVTHKVAKKLRKIVWQNIIFAMLVVLFLIGINIFEGVNMSLAVIIHEGSTILVLLNGLRMLRDLSS